MFAQFEECARATGGVHQAIEELCDPAMELTFGRPCADVVRVSHLLRASGDVIAEGPVGEHDLQKQAFLERVLGGELGPAALDQATLGLHAGGLGLRRAADAALVDYWVEHLASVVDQQLNTV